MGPTKTDVDTQPGSHLLCRRPWAPAPAGSGAPAGPSARAQGETRGPQCPSQSPACKPPSGHCQQNQRRTQESCGQQRRSGGRPGDSKARVSVNLDQGAHFPALPFPKNAKQHGPHPQERQLRAGLHPSQRGGGGRDLPGAHTAPVRGGSAHPWHTGQEGAPAASRTGAAAGTEGTMPTGGSRSPNTSGMRQVHLPQCAQDPLECAPRATENDRKEIKSASTH